MKFTKTALAVAAIVGSVAASAQTANVTLYGYINTSIESNRGSTATTSSTVNRMTANSSRFGFRGREELGGGLYAMFFLENSFNSDDGGIATNGASSTAIPSNNGAAIMWGREAWVGLGNPGWGEVKFGYGLTPFLFSWEQKS